MSTTLETALDAKRAEIGITDSEFASRQTAALLSSEWRFPTAGPCTSCGSFLGADVRTSGLCERCTDPDGRPRSFAEVRDRVARQFAEQHPALSPSDADSRAVRLLGSLPAWDGVAFREPD